MKIYSVIGSGYGDEGKGLAVDALTQELSAQGDVTVVRVNGGAQAGHTVQTPSGDRHVFHQFGAGSLIGAATHWSADFVASPMFLGSERDDLSGIGGRGEAVSADPDVVISTPWDVMINQAVEQSRGSSRHGSCGMGFGETIERTEQGWGLRMRDLHGSNTLSILKLIRKDWFPARMAALGLALGDMGEMAQSDALMAAFLRDLEAMLDQVRMVSDAEIGARGGVLITEGAQGIGLDMSVGAFPHVTRSHTGLRNVVRFARRAGVREIDALYMTRAYATRHGAGPMPGERDISAWAAVNDPTNAPNAWQGTLRCGALDLDLIRSRMDADAETCDPQDIQINRMIGISCLDQITDTPAFITGGEVVSEDPVRVIFGALGGEVRLTSQGPDREHVSLNI